MTFKNSIVVTLGGQEVRLKPTFQAIMDMEERLGGLIALAMRASEGDFGLKEATIIIWSTMEERQPLEAVGGLILEKGLAQVSGVVRDVLTLCLSGVKSPERN